MNEKEYVWQVDVKVVDNPKGIIHLIGGNNTLGRPCPECGAFGYSTLQTSDPKQVTCKKCREVMK